MNYYELSDNLISFWYRFIFDNKEEILQNMGRLVYEDNKEEILQFISLGFENVSISFLSEKNIKGLLPYHYNVIKNYKVDNSKLGRSIELDGLASGIGKAKDRLLVIECKYRNKPISLSTLEHLRESLTIFPYKYYDIYLFSKTGFSEDLLSLNNESINLIYLEDMIKSES